MQPPVLSLSKNSMAAIANIVDRAVLARCEQDYEGFTRQAGAASCMAKSSIPGLNAWADSVAEYGLGVIQNLPLEDDLPPTPHQHARAPRLPRSEAIVGMVATVFGALYVLADKLREGHIHDVYFVPEDADTQLGSGSSHLQWHVEDGCHPVRPHWVILYCLRGGPGVSTHFARLNDMEFTPEQHALLRSVPVPLLLDESFASAETSHAEPFTSPAIIPGDNGEEIIFDPAFTDIQTDSVARVIEALSVEAERVRKEWILQPGELLIFNNRRMIHARSGFDPSTLDGQRWIKRALVTSSPGRCTWVEPGVARNA